MRKLIILIMALWSMVLPAQELITEAEYFIDQSPVAGSGTNIPIASANELIALVQVPIATLGSGLHTLGLRVRSSEGAWSVYGRKQFWIATWSSASSVQAAEYFINDDPGVGSATAIPITAGPESSGSTVIELSELMPGLNTLCMRFRDNEGLWSVYAREHFYVLPTGNNNQLIAAEYYFDEDPGFGSGTALDIPTAAEVNTNFVIALPEQMEPGLHVFLMRTRDASGTWSVPQRHLFFYHPTDPALEITAAEYFIDEDPGTGDATALSVSPSGTLEEVYDIATPASLAEGDHVLYMRVQRSDGKWSIYALHPFTLDFSVGTSVHSRSFSLYPNPTSDALFVETEGAELNGVRVYDMQGKMVLHEGRTGQPITMGHLGKGTYLVQLQFSDGYAVSKRVVVQ